jgi:hypothetical protein
MPASPSAPSEDLGIAKSKSVSLPLRFWDMVEEHAQAIGKDRSGYFRALAENDLRAAGKLQTGVNEEIAAQAYELAQLVGPDRVKAKLAELTAETAVQMPLAGVTP